jgi:hypothetical protein
MIARKNHKTHGLGRAGEKLMAGEFLLARIPIEEMPPNHRDYDLIAYPRKNSPQRICVKCRPLSGSQIHFRPKKSDWLAIVLVEKRPHRFFIVPHKVAAKHSKSAFDGAFLRIYPRNVPKAFSQYENNFRLNPRPKRAIAPVSSN